MTKDMERTDRCPRCGSDQLSPVEVDGRLESIYCHACGTFIKDDETLESRKGQKAALTREAITALLQANFGLERLTARKVLNFTINAIKAALNSGNPVHLKGFGRFDKRIRPPKNVKDFKTDGRVWLDSAPTIRFKPSKSWLKRMDNKD